ncbi:TRAP transporter large permease [Burkholderia sp. PAMC 26561]|uniref:TRAP transporter large permease n=1 Tax=Burkholderia sp. PAMC 26561 TaxID=1795043 RepID=UPI00076B8E0A|nr:TRAP transporter large permease subunit [Burkholderia sp. PAMC 26561]AME26952.1 ABC transporter permease [Burkholderia sp. PAMC 26561]AME27902.1 ABC transporter permease [Burkholderia sp. PAMC 26561]
MSRAEHDASSLWQRCAGICDRWLGTLVETVTACALAIEVALLLAGVSCRYLLHQPLTWSDELASTLFAWVASLGAAIAYRRMEHMRMVAFVSRQGRGPSARFDAFSMTASLMLLAILLMPAIQYAVSEFPIETDSLAISGVWRAAALPAGIGLMIVFGLLRLGRQVRLPDFALALALIAVIATALYLCKPSIVAMGLYNLLIFFVVIVGGAIFAGVPIAFAFGLGTLAYLSIVTHAPTDVMIGRMEEGMSHLVLLAVPLFIFLGALVVVTGMAKAMVGLLARLFGHVRGGLHYVLVGAMYLVSGISGSKAADMAAVAPVLFPEMRARGAKDGDLIALLSATGAQTETVPPSIVLITIGSVTSVSIADLFVGGLMPALLLGLMLCAGVWFKYRHDSDQAARSTWPEIARAFVVALPALVLPFVVRFAVIKGIATATEVSTVGIAYALAYAVLISVLFRKPVAWGRIWHALADTASLSGAILLIIGTATAMAWALTQSGFSTGLAALLAGLPGGRATFLAVSIVAFMVLGSVLEGIPAIVLFGPLLFPIAKALGVHEVHYAMVVVLSMGIGLFAPPFGVGYYAACAVARIDPSVGMRPIARYLLVLFAGTVIVAAFPWLSTGFL